MPEPLEILSQLYIFFIYFFFLSIYISQPRKPVCELDQHSPRIMQINMAFFSPPLSFITGLSQENINLSINLSCQPGGCHKMREKGPGVPCYLGALPERSGEAVVGGGEAGGSGDKALPEPGVCRCTYRC